LVGTTLLATAVALATYLIARAALKLYHRRYPRVAERAARRREVAAFHAESDRPIHPDERVH
jgi:hypothetical protein